MRQRAVTAPGCRRASSQLGTESPCRIDLSNQKKKTSPTGPIGGAASSRAQISLEEVRKINLLPVCREGYFNLLPLKMINLSLSISLLFPLFLKNPYLTDVGRHVCDLQLPSNAKTSNNNYRCARLIEAGLLAGICSRECVCTHSIFTLTHQTLSRSIFPPPSPPLLPLPFFYFLSLFRLTLRVSRTSLAVMEGQERGQQRSEM